jgi:hypothetical protein
MVTGYFLTGNVRSARYNFRPENYIYTASVKDYLIIIFVGLLLVVIFAIMLSAWCCRGEMIIRV